VEGELDVGWGAGEEVVLLVVVVVVRSVMYRDLRVIVSSAWGIDGWTLSWSSAPPIEEDLDRLVPSATRSP
jgi:hypothetical protein